MYQCPSGDCDFVTGSLEGMAMHYVNSEDSAHQAYDKKWLVKQAVTDSGPSASDSKTDSARSDSKTDSGPDDVPGPDLPEFPARSDSGPGEVPDRCCPSQDLVGSAGDAFRLSDGRIIRLGEGTQICTNCEEIQEVTP